MPNINEFKSRLSGGGARANQFKVTMTFPGYSSVGGETSDLAFLCSATALPGQTVGQVAIPFRGRVLNIAGDRTFEPWTITVLNDTDFKLYRAFERWMNGINNHSTGNGLSLPSDYMQDLVVNQLDINENVLKSYLIVGAFPSTVGAISLDVDSTDEIEEFPLTFQYQYWDSTTTT